MTDSLRYIAVLAACLIITLPLELTGLARVYRRPLLLLATLTPVLVVFGAWDAIAAGLGQWWWSPRYVLGLRLAGLPVEEWLFFITIPACAVLTYEAVGEGAKVAARARARTRGTDVAAEPQAETVADGR